MRILFTGGSSFTGVWFIRALVDSGHEVVATFRQPLDQYEGVRRERVSLLPDTVNVITGVSFGDDDFLDLIGQEDNWDALCHHAADVTDYKSSSFDVAAAVQNNTRRVANVLEGLAAKGCTRVVLTGSVFENGEGAGSQGLPAFSPYGLSKALTSEMFAYYTSVQQLRLGKFVIANPFGPHEEPRFTAYLMRKWRNHETAGVNTPAYIRDNIHVSLLAKAYADFVTTLGGAPGLERFNPSGYVESQGAFAERFAREMRARLGWPCELDLADQVEFPEPRIRINCDPVDIVHLGWDESAAWDELARYYELLGGSA